MKSSGHRLLFVERFLITVSNSWLVIDLFILSISSWLTLPSELSYLPFIRCLRSSHFPCHGHTQVLEATWSMICPSANDIVPRATIALLHNSSLRLNPGSDQLKATPEKHPTLLFEGTHQFPLGRSPHQGGNDAHNSSNTCWAGVSAPLDVNASPTCSTCLPLSASFAKSDLPLAHFLIH